MRSKLLYMAWTLCAVLSGCTTGATGGRRLFGIPLPSIFDSDAAIQESDPDYQWMFQLLAVSTLGFAIVSSWLAKRVTKSGMILFGLGFTVSAWGLSMDAIKKSANLYIPWVVGAFILYGAIDVYMKYRLRRGKNSLPKIFNARNKDAGDTNDHT
jgi:TRAP-type uncharacterized transport system fused permease subunit